MSDQGKTVISLTSIPPRFHHLETCVGSLLNQSARIDEVVVYIPKTYRRFPQDFALPVLPEGAQLRIVADDLGPATKVLPAVRDYDGTDTRILFCDDDRIYDPDWAKRLISASDDHPDCAIASMGHRVSDFEPFAHTTDRFPTARFIQKDVSYRLKRVVSLGGWKPKRIVQSGYTDILCGWAGCLVRPEFFVAEDHAIPDVLWTVDDFWLSGCLNKNGVPIWLEGFAGSTSEDRPLDGTDASALRGYSYNGYDRMAANRLCIAHFQEKYAIWVRNIAAE